MSRLLPACLCGENFRSRRVAETGSMAGWLVGLEFEPTNSTPLLGLRPSSPEAGMEADSDRFRSGSCDFRASAIRDGRDGV
jgi:hypothetical protein